MSEEIIRRPANVLASAEVMGEAQFDNVSRMAKALAASGQFKDITQWEQAFGRMLLGADMGLTPTQALMSIDVVRGNVQVRGKRLLAWVKQSEHYDFLAVRVDWREPLLPGPDGRHPDLYGGRLVRRGFDGAGDRRRRRRRVRSGLEWHRP
jgi:hypothetical protein